MYCEGFVENVLSFNFIKPRVNETKTLFKDINRALQQSLEIEIMHRTRAHALLKLSVHHAQLQPAQTRDFLRDQASAFQDA